MIPDQWQRPDVQKNHRKKNFQTKERYTQMI